MEDDASQGEDEEDVFTLELTPSEMYSLNRILHYNAINMDNPEYAHTCEVLVKNIQDAVGSEEFNDAMQREVEEYKENYTRNRPTDKEDPAQVDGHGVQ